MRSSRQGVILFGVVVGMLCAVAAGHSQVITGGPPTCKAIAFTFDMCPVREGSGYDEPLIKELIEKQIPATFFLSGRWVARHDREVKALLQVPYFEFGTHGHVHAHLPMLDAAQQRQEILTAVDLLRTRYERPTTLFRPPYGEYDDTTLELVNALGLRFILWNAVSGDPDPHLTRERMDANLLATIRNGSMLVFHSNGKGRHTREVVADLYQALVVSRGFKAVTVTELLSGCENGTRR